MVAGGVDRHGRANDDRRAVLWRAGCDDAAARAVNMSICAKRLQSALGISLRLDFFLVIQTGTIAAVAVGFARYMGVLVPWSFANEMDHSANDPFAKLRVVSFRPRNLIAAG